MSEPIAPAGKDSELLCSQHLQVSRIVSYFVAMPPLKNARRECHDVNYRPAVRLEIVREQISV